MPISIHAPLAGSDDSKLSSFVPRRYFNPRSPRRERHCYQLPIRTCYKFQSTLPSQGATELNLLAPIQPEISIHAPLAGSDRTASWMQRSG